MLASQLISQFKSIWESENLALWLRPVRVMVNANMSGIMETVTDALSVHSIKKQFDGSLYEYFVHVCFIFWFCKCRKWITQVPKKSASDSLPSYIFDVACRPIAHMVPSGAFEVVKSVIQYLTTHSISGSAILRVSVLSEL